jgi:hypothetical protein
MLGMSRLLGTQDAPHIKLDGCKRGGERQLALRPTDLACCWPRPFSQRPTLAGAAWACPFLAAPAGSDAGHARLLPQPAGSSWVRARSGL